MHKHRFRFRRRAPFHIPPISIDELLFAGIDNAKTSFPQALERDTRRHLVSDMAQPFPQLPKIRRPNKPDFIVKGSKKTGVPADKFSSGPIQPRQIRINLFCRRKVSSPLHSVKHRRFGQNRLHKGGGRSPHTNDITIQKNRILVLRKSGEKPKSIDFEVRRIKTNPSGNVQRKRNLPYREFISDFPQRCINRFRIVC